MHHMAPCSTVQGNHATGTDSSVENLGRVTDKTDRSRCREGVSLEGIPKTAVPLPDIPRNSLPPGGDKRHTAELEEPRTGAPLQWLLLPVPFRDRTGGHPPYTWNSKQPPLPPPQPEDQAHGRTRWIFPHEVSVPPSGSQCFKLQHDLWAPEGSSRPSTFENVTTPTTTPHPLLCPQPPLKTSV
ncbi:hypothetical protein AAFF_G00137360 [Aldrovandia affinis]|uniref:Uncharacterized protein n=1 Tax=Aldrovandia affinis TaxID=143900 RepID=A0AAD7TCC7_9TELE|nr:hypothetical protein AAFF_G00137360 [Aldrovandia affinis]